MSSNSTDNASSCTEMLIIAMDRCAQSGASSTAIVEQTALSADKVSLKPCAWTRVFNRRRSCSFIGEGSYSNGFM